MAENNYLKKSQPALQFLGEIIPSLPNLSRKCEFSKPETLGVTGNHPFWKKDKGWTESDLLKVGDSVQGKDSAWLTVQGLKPRADKATGYNLEVEGDHSYFVGDSGAWVHNAGGCINRFINDVKVTDRRTGTTLQGTVDLQPTLDRISSGQSFPHRNDGSIFQNRPSLGQSQPSLPVQNPGYYKEYVHPTPGVSGPGSQRIVVGQGGEMYYTPDHYKTFIPVNP